MRGPNGEEAAGAVEGEGGELVRAALDEGQYENRVAYREGDTRQVEGVEAGVEGSGGLGGSAFGRAEPAKSYPRAPKVDPRCDERVREDICEELMHCEDIDPSDVEVAVREGEVRLAGTVPERSMKVRIEQIADRCAGVVEIVNEIRVVTQ